MLRSFAGALLLAYALSAPAQTSLKRDGASNKETAVQQVRKPVAVKKKSKATKARRATTSATSKVVSAKQLAIASRVFVGRADCELQQTVHLSKVKTAVGYFKLRYRGRRYVMVPEETTTNVVRLVDRKTGMIWLQTPAKSMLLSGAIGQRLVDECKHTAQRSRIHIAKRDASTTRSAPRQASTRTQRAAPA